MPKGNLFELEFSNQELSTLEQALASIEQVIQGKTLLLSAEERRQFGSVNEENKLLINKAKEIVDEYEDFLPRRFDKPAFEKDYEGRVVLERLLQRARTITDQLRDTKIMLDFDNFQDTMRIYREIRHLHDQQEPGTEALYLGMKQFFKGGRSKPTQEEEA